jgi:tetratricopeptide (TPR) repeat protein
MSPWALWLSMILLIGTGIAADVPFVFDSSSSGVAGFSADQLESLRVSSPDLAGVPTVTQVADKDVLDFPITGGGNIPVGTIDKNVGDLKKTLDAAVEPDNPRVREEALVLALMYPGDLTVDQICSIYSYLKNGDSSKKGWGYVRDPRGLDYFNYANASLKAGDRANCVGGGDCDDFAILMSALVESVGGTTRIILARNNTTGGHAYTEVYLGNLNAQNNQVEDIISWLKEKFDTDKIYTHIDTATKDVWLNLDWGADEKGNAHPGGPFYQGDKHIVLCIRDTYRKTPLRTSESYQEQARPNNAVTPKTKVNVNGTAKAWNNMGLDLCAQDKYDEAIEAFDKAIEIDPEYAEAWYNKGNALYAQSKYNEAMQAFDKAIEIDPHDVYSWHNKGMILYEHGKYDEALEAFDKAIEINPQLLFTWEAKGNALKSLGRAAEANAAFAKANESYPRDKSELFGNWPITKLGSSLSRVNVTGHTTPQGVWIT